MMTCLSSAFNVGDVDIEEVIAEVTSVIGERPQLVLPIPDWEGNNPEIPCTACGLRIQPFIHRYVLRSESFHPVCYERMQQGD